MIEKYLRRAEWFQSKLTTLILLGFIAIIGFFLITQHPVHFLNILPFALILFCPLTHVFMMRGMHSHHEEHADDGGQHLDRQSFNQMKVASNEGAPACDLWPLVINHTDMINGKERKIE